jgi:putative transposase
MTVELSLEVAVPGITQRPQPALRGYEKHDPAGAGTGNIRDGTRGKTVLTEASGQVEIEVPRDRAGTFDPQIVKKRQR